MIKSLMAILLIAVLPAAVPARAADHHEHHEMMMGAALPGTSLYNLSSEWTTQEGQRESLGALRGRPVVAAMVFTSCTDMCPLTIEHIRHIQDEVNRLALGPVRYVLWSFDSQRDTPKRLKDYAQSRGLEPENWTLMQGDPAAVRDLAAVLGISYRRDANGDYDHSFAITLLDRDGNIAFQQTGLQTDTGEFVKRITAMNAAAHHDN